MGNLVYLVAALGLAALGTLFLVWRARTPSGMQHNIRNFADQLDSLAPERRRVIPRPYDMHIPPVDNVAPIYRSVKLVEPEAPVEEIAVTLDVTDVDGAAPTDDAHSGELSSDSPASPDTFSRRPGGRSEDDHANPGGVHPHTGDRALDDEVVIELSTSPGVFDGPAPVHGAMDVLDPRSFDVPSLPVIDETSEMDRARLAALALPSAVDPSTLPPIEELLTRQPRPSDPLVLPKAAVTRSRAEHS
jgi:hypothetical protein